MSETIVSILHITTHLGGGVGKALSSIVTHERNYNARHRHKILLLDEPEKYQFVNICREGGVDVLLKDKSCSLARELAAADIVILHWWHHPIMASFLANFPNIPVRLVLWAHVNGCTYPCLPYNFATSSHRTFFTSPFSLENSYWTASQRKEIRRHSAIVYGLGKLEFDNPLGSGRTSSADFVVGYVGTLNSSKLHPQFVEFCRMVLQKVPDARFAMVGDMDGRDDILQKAKECHIEDQFDFIGYSNRIADELSHFDVFAYPLNPKHFGTTENALLEAMALGLPVVALNQNAEKYIINEQNEVGLLANNIEHYAECIAYLHDNPTERARIGSNAREYVRKHFRFEINVERMRTALDRIACMAPRQFDFVRVFGKEPYEWFLACLGEDSAPFADSIDGTKQIDATVLTSAIDRIKSCNPILKEKTKSSIRHFADVFPEDMKLQYWKGLLDGR